MLDKIREQHLQEAFLKIQKLLQKCKGTTLRLFIYVILQVGFCLYQIDLMGGKTLFTSLPWPYCCDSRCPGNSTSYLLLKFGILFQEKALVLLSKSEVHGNLT